MPLVTPEPLEVEHAELHADLKAAIARGGKVGEAARNVADLLHPHFVKEEQLALPLLGLLRDLADGTAIADAPAALRMAQQLKRELPAMLAEHQKILAALDTLAAAAKDVKDVASATFAEQLKLHAQTEEQVMYPAAILVGELLQTRQSRHAA